VKEATIVWSDYMRYRVRLRGFDLARLEEIVRYSSERYVDTVTGRCVVVGRHGESLVMVPCESEEGVVVPVTAHVTSRRQVTFRVKTGRFRYE